MGLEEVKHLKKNLEAALEDLDKSEKEIEELKLKVSGSQVFIKKLRKDLKDFSTSDLGKMVKKMNQENTSLKDQIEELDEKLVNNQESYEEQVKENKQLVEELRQENMKILELENIKK